MRKVSSRELKFPENTAKTASLFKMAAKQAMKENLQCTSKYGHLRVSQDICHVRMTDIEGFLTIYGHSDNLLNNNDGYFAARQISATLHRHVTEVNNCFIIYQVSTQPVPNSSFFSEN